MHRNIQKPNDAPMRRNADARFGQLKANNLHRKVLLLSALGTDLSYRAALYPGTYPIAS